MNILFVDGHVVSADNTHDDYTVDARTNLQASFQYILNALEKADALRTEPGFR